MGRRVVEGVGEEWWARQSRRGRGCRGVNGPGLYCEPSGILVVIDV